MESTKPKCPECNCGTIVMTTSEESIYEVNSIGTREFEGENILEATDTDLVDTDETGTTIYSCTDCEFESADLASFNPRKWIGLAALADEDCEHCEIVEVLEGETVQEVKDRLIFARPPWHATKPDAEMKEYERKRWDTFVFTNAKEVAKLLKIDTPDYTDDLSFAVSDTMWHVYEAFADEFSRGDK